MPDERPFSANRIAIAIRRFRALLSTPELLNKFDSQITDISNRLSELSAITGTNLDNLQSALKAGIRDELKAAIAHFELAIERLNAPIAIFKGELSAQLHDQTKRISCVEAVLKTGLEELQESVNRCETIQDSRSSLQQVQQSIATLKVDINSQIDGLAQSHSGLRDCFTELSSELISRINKLETFQFEARNIVAGINTSLNSRLNSLETFQLESRNILIELNTSLNSRMNSIETFQVETRNLLAHLNTSLNSRLNGVETFQSEARNLIGELNTSLNSRMNSLETLQFESKNLLIESNTSLNSRMNSLETYQFETRNLLSHAVGTFESRLNVFENEKLPAITNQLQELIAVQFNLFNESRAQKRQQKALVDEKYEPTKGNYWNASLERARGDFPSVYRLWKERLDTMLDAFRQTTIGNAAWAGDVKSRIFRCFVDRYAHGRVLDVGCGVFGRPYYLLAYPAELISGIDPLKPEKTPDFEFVRGISEYLPWPEASFSTVISATSLDHCLSLDRSLSEIHRVLRPEGCFLLWIDSVPGAPKFDPANSNFIPFDQFHLFHFDTAWFEPMLNNMFDIIDRIELQRVGFVSVIYCLSWRKWS